jgi:hypothetical protein
MTNADAPTLKVMPLMVYAAGVIKLSVNIGPEDTAAEPKTRESPV